MQSQPFGKTSENKVCFIIGLALKGKRRYESQKVSFTLTNIKISSF